MTQVCWQGRKTQHKQTKLFEDKIWTTHCITLKRYFTVLYGPPPIGAWRNRIGCMMLPPRAETDRILVLVNRLDWHKPAGLPLGRHTAFITSWNRFRTPKLNIKRVPRTSENFSVQTKIITGTSRHAHINPPTFSGLLKVFSAFLSETDFCVVIEY